MNQKYSNSIGVLVPEVMLPPQGTDMKKWAVVACDQFTSQKEYWEEARKIIGDAPSTLDLILPEAYLGSPDEPERIAAIRKIIGDREILSPGVGAQGGSAADAIKAGADYVIVGRAIYKAENPRAVAEQICKEIQSVL